MDAVRDMVEDRINKLDDRLFDENLLEKANFKVITSALLTTRRELKVILDNLQETTHDQ